jgi:GT2 family glycosyltransferase
MNLKKITTFFKNKSREDELKKKLHLIKQVEFQKINFTITKNPIVSIVIPFYNEVEITINCLWHLKKHLTSKFPYEIILINDNSTEAIKFSEINGIKLINNSENLGFLRNINKGIKEAKGEYIYILNNDTEVKKGFLEELFYVFNNFKNVGAVGSKLINIDGTLQEAGAVFLTKGRIKQIVKNKKNDAPEINYINKVDYCSGASLLFKKQKDNGELNQFDTDFVPAYFEETDFCFSLKYEQGKDVYYTPFSEVVHFDGVSYNSKKSKKIKQELFETNKVKFFKKWKAQIEDIKASTISERVHELYSKSIAFYSKQVLEFDKESGANRFNEIIKSCISNNIHVSLLVKKAAIDSSYVRHYRRLGVQVYYKNKSQKSFKKFIKNEIANLGISWFYGPNSFKSHYNLVKKTCNQSLIVYDMIDIHHLRFERAYEIEPSNYYKKRIKKYKNLEINSCKKADIIIAISESEKNYISKLGFSEKVKLISNIHSIKLPINSITKFEDRKDLLFIGSKHHPNIDAVMYLYESIMPKVWEVNASIQVHIVGGVGDLISTISDKRFIFHGYVSDVSNFFNNSKLMVVPLRVGAGVKGKIGHAFEYHLPVVTTGIGAEGMALSNNESALISDDELSFSKSIIELYSNKKLWQKLSNNSETSLKPYSIEKAFENVLKMK